MESAIKAYKLAWKYRRAVEAQWKPRLPELQELDVFHRTYVAYENAETRAEWLCEEAGDLLLRVVSGRKPMPVHPDRAEFFVKCKNRRFVQALDAFVDAFVEADEGTG